MLGLFKQVANEAQARKHRRRSGFHPPTPSCRNSSFPGRGTLRIFLRRERSWVLSFPEIQAAAQNLLQQGRREFGHRGVLFLYVEVGGRLRTKLEEIFSSRLQVADGAL